MAGPSDVDPTLLVRVASMSRGSQRWLKTVLQTIQASDLDAGEERERAEPEPMRRPPPRLQRAPANLEDVITGKADLREQLESYPELSNELEGLAEVIDLLREAGERRRKRGEDVLRELLEGEQRERDRGQEEEGGEEPPRRPRR
jgi:hypothetical protein